ncbi:MAG TPA: oxidoreductase, partial [Pirellulales bacterium]|nr:oxidoreductase [Pirellulales bacterium]
MSELHWPWLELSVVVPLCGAIWVAWLRDPDRARKGCLACSGVTFLCTIAAWQDFGLLHASSAEDRWLTSRLLGRDLFVVDEISAPLLPLVGVLY